MPAYVSHAVSMHYGYGYGYILGPSPVPPIYLSGSFGPVLPPGWLDYTRSTGRLGAHLWLSGTMHTHVYVVAGRWVGPMVFCNPLTYR